MSEKGIRHDGETTERAFYDHISRGTPSPPPNPKQQTKHRALERGKLILAYLTLQCSVVSY